MSKFAITVGRATLSSSALERLNWCGRPVQTYAQDGFQLHVIDAFKEETDAHGNFLIFAGVPLNAPSITQCPTINDAKRLIPQADGAFVGLYWNRVEGKLLIVNDFAGYQPLYLGREGDTLIMASETKVFTAKPDLTSWGAFISFGHTLGTQTLAQGVSLPPPGSLIEIEPASLGMEIARHWSWPETRAGTQPSDLLAVLRQNAQDYCELASDSHILLSGGIDSRLMLCILRDLGIKPKALIHSHSDELLDADGSFATAVARAFDLERTVYGCRRDFFSSEHFIDFLIANDAATPCLYLFISQILSILPEGTVWEGMVPGIIGSLPVLEDGLDGLLSRIPLSEESSPWQAAKTVFRPQSYDAIRYGFHEHLKKLTKNYDKSNKGVMQFILQNRMRHRVAPNPLKVYPNKSKVLPLGMCKEFWELGINIDPREKAKKKHFYLRIFEKNYPGVLRIPFVSGGKFVQSSKVLPDFNFTYWCARQIQRLTENQIVHAVWWRLAKIQKQKSKFLQLSVLLNNDEDPHLNVDALNRIDPRSPHYDAAMQLLFHWQAWKWVHEGTLKERLLDSRACS